MGDPGAWCSWSQDRYTPLKPHLVKFYGIHLEGSGEMTQWLTALAALTEDLGLSPSTYTVSHNHLEL